jgi:hypothetical protein
MMSSLVVIVGEEEMIDDFIVPANTFELTTSRSTEP